MKPKHRRNDVKKSRVLPGIAQSSSKNNLTMRRKIEKESTNVEKINWSEKSYL